MKKMLAAVCALWLATPFTVMAEEETAKEKGLWRPAVNVAFDARVDFDYDKPDGEKSHSGFHGRYFNLKVDGRINDKITYSLRQRLNKFKDCANDVFAATDWLYLTYKPTAHWALSGGKQIVAIGGFEYDRAPIDIYYASRFWNNIACYQFGVSGAYISASGRHSVLAQVCNSPYQNPGSSCYAYNLMWNGRMGVYSTIWSVNLLEYERDHYCNYITLGNRIDFPGFYAELDLMNRYSPHQKFWFADYSVIAKAAYTIRDRVTIFAKGGHERYKPVPGMPEATDKPFYGAGVEWYPLLRQRQSLRLHLVWDTTHDNAGLRTWQLSAGVKWFINLYSYKK